MDGGFQQLASGHGNLPSQSGREVPLHRTHSRGSYKHLHSSRDDWLDAAQQITEPPRGTSETVSWFSVNQTQGSLSSTSPAKGGFMLATNLSNIQQQFPPSSNHTPSLVPHTPSTIPPTTSSTGQSHKGFPTAPSLLWGELERREKEGEGEGEKEESLRPLWQEGWRAEALVCSLPQLHQHLPPPKSRDERNSILPFLEHPKDSSGHNPILHSVDLQHHIRDVDQISRMSGANFQPSDLPPLPEQFWSSKVKKAPHDPLKAPVAPPMPITLDPTSVALLLRKSTAAICSQSGYHSTSLRALDTLAGVLGHFLCQLSQQLCIHHDQQKYNESAEINTQDPLEQCLWACGIQGRAELHKFWKTEIEADMQRLQNRAMKLHEDPVPSSPLPPAPTRPLNLSLTPWPTEPEMTETINDEISLEEALNTNLDIAAPAATPDPGGVQMFLDFTGQEPEAFSLLTPDLPARKRLRTTSSISE